MKSLRAAARGARGDRRGSPDRQRRQRREAQARSVVFERTIAETQRRSNRGRTIAIGMSLVVGVTVFVAKQQQRVRRRSGASHVPSRTTRRRPRAPRSSGSRSTATRRTSRTRVVRCRAWRSRCSRTRYCTPRLERQLGPASTPGDSEFFNTDPIGAIVRWRERGPGAFPMSGDAVEHLAARRRRGQQVGARRRPRPSRDARIEPARRRGAAAPCDARDRRPTCHATTRIVLVLVWSKRSIQKADLRTGS